MKTRNFSVADLPEKYLPSVRKQLEAQAQKTPEKPAKYRNASVVVDGYRFPSQRESLRYLVLKDAQNRGEITGLRIQPAWRIEYNGVLIADYVADFTYIRDGMSVVEDVKSKFTKTKDYRIKRKLMLAFFRIDVQEVT